MTDKDDLLQRQGTHSDGCYAFGHRHYECALVEIERLRAEVDRVTEERDIQIAIVDAWHKRHAIDSRNLRSVCQQRDDARKELAEIRQQRDDLIAELSMATTNKRTRVRMPNEAFNDWLDMGISDSGHTVYDTIGNINDAYDGWRAAELHFMAKIESAESELAALRGRIAASPVVCIDNGACVTDGARLTIAGGDTYFVHAELCGKRVRLLIEPTSSDLPPSCVPVPDRSPGSSTR